MRTCTVCRHPNRDEIDAALLAGEPERSIAARFGSLSRGGVQRHRALHIPTALTKGQDALEVARADNLIAQLGSLHDRAEAILTQAEAAGELRTALSAIRELRGNLELLAKLLGELKEAQVSEASPVNLTVMVDGKAVEDEMARRAAMTELLRRFTIPSRIEGPLSTPGHEQGT